jgi:stage IV sporulation protein FB
VNFLEPAPTPLDLKWRLFGVRFRVHPSFWVIAAIFGMMGTNGVQRQDMLVYILMWMLTMFISVLVHELGHVIAGRIFGEPGHIVLYSFGGYTMGSYDQLQRWQRILVAIAGPVAGLLFLIAINFFDYTYWNYGVLGSFGLDLSALRVPTCLMDRIDPNFWLKHSWYRTLFADLVLMNLFWSLVNLLPVIPLDGGNILREVCTGAAPRSGLRLALGLSFLIAGLVAVYSGFKLMRADLPYPPLDPTFNIILFGLLAFQNYNALRAVEMQQRHAEYFDD